MSAIIIESAICTGVPRFSDVKLSVSESILGLPTQEYFCPQGHSFSLTFSSETSIPCFWECPKCETISPNHPL